MAYRSKRGMGACAGQTASIWSNPGAVWDYILHGCPAISVAAPGAPTGSVLTVAPASGVDAQATVDALLNKQLADQQALDAAGVQSTWIDQTLGTAGNVGSGAASLLSTAFPWILGGLGLFAVVAAGGGSPRRYGR